MGGWAAVIASAGAHVELEVLGVLLGVSALLVAAYRTHVPYPILLVIGGAVLASVPGVPDVALNPDLVLLIFLPPLLYSAAFFSSLRDLRANLRPISLLSVGCVLATMGGVAVVSHAVVPGMDWKVAFVLGAVLSPTDAIAATAIASRVGAPRRFVTVVEGESLVNDATALVVYKVALAALVSGSFDALDAGASFVGNAAAGVGIGLVVGWVMTHTRRAIEDPPTEIALSLVTPYFAYLPAEAAGVSAVLAAVTSGIFLGWRSPRIIAPQTRIQAFAVWEIVQFVLNAALFALVGLALPSVVRGIGDRYGWADAFAYAAAVSGAVILVRFLWVFPATYLPRAMSRRIRSRDPYPPWQHVVLVAWTGMRGGVSLAAALAIPTTLDSGAALPMRDLVIFLTYGAIFATLVLQGLSLPWLMARLDVHDDGKDARLEVKARIKAAKAAIARLEAIVGEDWVRNESAERMRGLYEFRIRRFRSRFDPDDDGDADAQSEAYQRLRREVLEAERAEIIRLRGDGFISDEVMHRIERDLDLEDARLEI